MLSETKQQVQDLINKVQVLDFTLNTLNLAHKDCASKVEELFLRASTHKMKLLEEILRLSNANELPIKLALTGSTTATDGDIPIK
jgi:hypothetical protein